MTTRAHLPNRRESQTLELELHGLKFTASFSFFPDGRLAEVFLQNHKPGSQSDVNARDAAVVTSIALQHGVTLEVICKALLRDSHGLASSPLGAALDRIAERDA
jgi:hypothetical protein